MNPETFEQVSLPRTALGRAEKFLRPEMRLPVELFDERPVGIVFPEIVDVPVAETAQPVHTQQDNTWKEAKLENGLQIMVPQFIRPGELIRVAVESGEYVERAKTEGKRPCAAGSGRQW